MSKRVFLIAVVILAIFGPWHIASSSEGENAVQLLFKDNSKELDVSDIHDGNIYTEFDFSNPTSQSVFVKSVKASCACANAVVSSDTIPPHRQGKISLSWKIGSKRDDLEKRIAVKVKGIQNPFILTVRVNLPIGLVISPEKLVWGSHEAPQEKVFDFTFPESDKLVIEKVTCSHSNFPVILEKSENLRSGKIKITPRSTGVSMKALVEISGLEDGTCAFRITKVVQIAPQ